MEFFEKNFPEQESEARSGGLLIQLHGFKMLIETHEKNVEMLQLAEENNMAVLQVQAPKESWVVAAPAKDQPELFELKHEGNTLISVRCVSRPSRDQILSYAITTLISVRCVSPLRRSIPFEVILLLS